MSSTQSIAISGLGSDEFDLSLKGLTCIHNVFKEHLAGTSFSGINTRLDNSYVTLFFSNRYFTHPRDMQNNIGVGQEWQNTIPEGLTSIHLALGES